jgi:Protease inhibitor Inh
VAAVRLHWYYSQIRYDLALILFAVFIATDAPAQQASLAQSEAFKAMIGKWEMFNADRDCTCTIPFRADPARMAFKLEMDKACRSQMPEVKDVVAWTIGGLDLVRLLDARGKLVMEFTEVESGIYEAPPGEGIFFMQTAAAAASPGRARCRADGRRLGGGARFWQGDLHDHADQFRGRSRQPLAQAQARLRCLRDPVRPVHLVHVSWRTGAQIRQGAILALRGKRPDQLEPRSPRTRGDQPGAPISMAVAVSTTCHVRWRRPTNRCWNEPW